MVDWKSGDERGLGELTHHVDCCESVVSTCKRRDRSSRGEESLIVRYRVGMA